MRVAGTDIDTDPEYITSDRQGGVLYKWSFSYWLDKVEYHVEFWARDEEDARRHARALAHNRVLRGRVVSQGVVRSSVRTSERPTHHVHRRSESLPCYCAATSDHAIGKEHPPAAPSSHVQVPTLDWEETEYISTDDDGGPMEGVPVSLKAWRAGQYLIIRQRSHDGLFLLRGKSDGVGLATAYLEAAKAAAQADYDGHTPPSQPMALDTEEPEK